MSGSHPNNYPKLHNAAWPGVVGKGGEGAEPCIELATMLDLTAQVGNRRAGVSGSEAMGSVL